MAQHHLRRGAYHSGNRLCESERNNNNNNNRAGGGHSFTRFTPTKVRTFSDLSTTGHRLPPNSWDRGEQQQQQQQQKSIYNSGASDFSFYEKRGDASSLSSHNQGTTFSSSAYPPVLPMSATSKPTPISSSQTVNAQRTLSPQYINTSLEPSSYLQDPTSQRKLLILDLNGTLVFRSPHRPRSKRFNPYSNDPTTQQRPPILRAVHPRPFLASFRQYLFHQTTRSWLDTMVWSSAQPHSVADMVERSFGDKKRDLVAVWARDTLDLSVEEYNRKTQTTKDLEKPWAFFSPSLLPSKDATKSSGTTSRPVHSAHTTLLLDDSPLKAHLQPWNHICIKEYVAEIRAADVAAALTTNLLKQQLPILSGRSEGPMVATTTNKTGGVAPVEKEAVAKTSFEEHRMEEEEEGEGEESRKWKRKQKKMDKKKKRDKVATTPQSPGEGESQDDGDDDEDTVRWWRKFDCTLLAIVGMLDTVKRESNVAAWVRNGGLWKRRRRRRTSPEHSPEEGLVGLAPLSGDIAQPPEAITHDHDKRHRGGDSTAAEGGDLWFDDESTKIYWIARGVRALRELDIDVDAGVKVP